MKECIVIGGGLGGLSSGILLAKGGYHITLLEQGAQIGGALQCFRRGGVSFETGMHYIGSADKGQIAGELLEILGIGNELELQRLDPYGYDIVSFGGELLGEQFKYANGHKGFIDQLCCYKESWRGELERYFKAVDVVAASSTINGITEADNSFSQGLKYQTLTMESVLDSLVDDPLLAEILAGTQPLYSAERNRTPFATHAQIMDFYNNSAFRFKGGSGRVAELLSKRLTALGGELHTHSKVVEIECNSKRATGVTTADGSHYGADLIISTIHPTAFAALLENVTIIRPAYRQRLKGLHNTSGVFTVYIKFKPGRMPYMNHNIFGFAGDTSWGCQEYNSENWPKGFLYTHAVPEDGGEFAQSGELITYMNYSDVAKWAGMPIGRRGAAYEEFKRIHGEKLITEAQRHAPGLAESIERWWSSTPLTYQDYTSTAEGAIYGVAKDVESTASRVSFRTKVPNIFLAGQSINSHGLLGVLVGSMVTCNYILGREKTGRNG